MSNPINRYHLSFAVSLPPVVRKLLIVHLCAYAFQALTGHAWDQLFGLSPSTIVSKGAIWQLVTYLFQHANPMHLLWNMLIMWMFGSELELLWGGRRFLRYYLLCGIGAGLFTVILGPHTSQITIGASGANFGLLMAFGLLFPNRTIIFMLIFPMKAKFFVIILGVLQLLLLFQDSGGGIAYGAHLGGLITGLVYFLALQKNLRGIKEMQRRSPFTRKPKLTLVRPPSESSRSHNSHSVGASDSHQATVDKILDKISALGLDSLSEKERQILEQASESLDNGRDNH